FGLHISTPVGSFQFHAIRKKCADLRRERTSLLRYGITHLRQVFFYSRFIVMVKYWTCGPGCSLYHFHGAMDLYHRIEYMFAWWNFIFDSSLRYLVGKVFYFCKVI